jgi:predicted DNA-binding protein (MmcQ/YjbR family)
MTTSDRVLAKVRRLVLALPDTEETPTWGKPHFRVGGKIFAGYEDDGERRVLGFKLGMAHAAARVRDPRFWPAPYVGHKGWVSMDVSEVRDWDEVRALLLESYGLIGGKRALAKLALRPSAPRKPARRAAAGSAAKARAKKRPG